MATPSLRQWRRALPERKTALRDLVAGLPGAISSVPDGMAAGLLAGVSPVNGLYASTVGPVAGGVTSSTRLMVVTTTSAGALATGSALSSIPAADRQGALTMLALIAGAVMIVAGILHLGRYTRFVSHSVMTGFLTGVAANIVFGQIPDLAGAPSDGSFAIEKALNVLIHPSWIDPASLIIGIVAGAIIVLLGRTPLSPYSALIALVLPTLAVILLGLNSVAEVKDAGTIPAGFPLPSLPGFSDLSFSVIGGGFAVAAIVLVQGAGVAESAPNPPGVPTSMNRNFISQGIGNVVSSLFKGQPVGGSVGQTALNVASGARTRWASIFSGLWMLLILLAFSGIIGYVAQPTLAALLIVAGVGSIRPQQILTIFRTGTISQVAMVSTFAATLFLPVAAAVGFGVALSLILQLNREAMDLKIVRLVPSDGGWREEKPPVHLPSHEVVALDVYGSLLYAGSRTLQSRAPDPAGSTGSAVVVRLRGRTQLGATFFLVLDDYARRLGASGGRLFLSGVDPHLSAQRDRNPSAPGAQFIEVVEATDLVGESTHEAFVAGRTLGRRAPVLTPRSPACRTADAAIVGSARRSPARTAGTDRVVPARTPTRGDP